MPRPKPRRVPRGAAPVAEPIVNDATTTTQHQEEEQQQPEPETRGRTRTSRNRPSTGDVNAMRKANATRDTMLDRLAAAEEEESTAAPNGSININSSSLGTPLRAVDTTGLDLADEMFELDESFDIGGDSLLQMPGSADSSTMSLRNLGRQRSRSRASSIVGRNELSIRPSSRNGATPLMSSSFNIGAFRRRKREPSILGTGRKSRMDTTGSVTGSMRGSRAGSVASSVAGSVVGSDIDVGSEAEMSPVVASTPKEERRRSTRSRVSAAAASVAREESVIVATQSPAKKRKSGDDVDNSDRPEKTSRIDSDAPELDDSDSELSSLDSPMAMPPLMLEPPRTPTRHDEDNAPPASSDSEDDGDIWPDIHALAKRRRRPSITAPEQLDRLSDVSSPPSLTHSPNFNATKRGGKRQRAQSPEITTAHLANLLPKRRVKKASEKNRKPGEEVDASGLAQDDDELTHLDTRAGSRRTRGKKAATSRTEAAEEEDEEEDHALQPRQTPATSTGRATRSSARSDKTYSRRASNKENLSGDEHEDENEQSGFVALPDDTFDEGAAAEERQRAIETEELKAAAKKFKEVDRWELEYEEVAEPSSPQDAR